MKIADIVAMAAARIKAAQASIATFADQLVKDPEHAVHWSTSLFGDTANLYAWKLVHNLAENGCEMDAVVDTLREYLVGGAARPSNTSNFAANYLEQEKVRAIAEIYRDFERRQRILKQMTEAQAAQVKGKS